jgi:hypothetical protein
LFATAGMAQTTSPNSMLKFSEDRHGAKGSGLKPAVVERIHAGDPIDPMTKSVVRFRRKQFVVLSVAVYGASLADMHQTLEVRKSAWWYETDPLARPFVKLPAPAYYASGLAMATGINWLSWKMGHSRKWHKWAPIPQLLAIAGNAYGFKSNRH